MTRTSFGSDRGLSNAPVPGPPLRRLQTVIVAMTFGALIVVVGMFGRASAQETEPVYRSAVMADSPIAFWRLGESSGTTAVDELGVAPGSYAGGPLLGRAGALPNEANTAVQFDGVDDVVSASGGVLSLRNALSAEAWVKPSALPKSGTATILRRGKQYGLDITAKGAIRFLLWSGGSSRVIKTANGAVAVGTWRHVAGTFDGATMRLYVDGVAKASTSLTAPLNAATAPLRLGSMGAGSRLAGTIDEAAVYGTALPANKVTAHFAAATATADTEPPAVTLTQPADGATLSDPRPTFSGSAGNAEGDAQTVSVKIYSGTSATGTPVQTLSANRSGGSWSASATQALTDGTYTAQAEQADAAGNVGTSAARTFTIAQPPPGNYAQEVSADAPRSHWRLGESSGTTAADAMGNHPGTYQFAPTLGRPGAIGGDPSTAVGFDGVDDEIRVPSASGLQMPNSFTVETWIKPAQLPSYTATLARKSGQYQLRLRYDGALSLNTWKNGSLTPELRTAAGLVTTDNWHHVAVTFDGSQLAIYLDGERRASTALTGPLSVSTSPLYFASSGGYDWFTGTLDEPAVYPTALSEARIDAHVDRAYAIDETPPTISLKTPAPASTMDAYTNFGGRAGTTRGDLRGVTVKLWEGTAASGTPARTLQATSRSSGTFSVLADPPLATGTYTARVEQSDASGNVGLSQPVTFSVDAQAAPSLLAAGDIASCSSTGDEATANLLDGQAGTVAPLGDVSQGDGIASEYANCYDPAWGRHLARTRAIPGDHDYGTHLGRLTADAFFDYFGAAGGATTGYYSFNLGSWHVVALNSVCYEYGSCEIAMEQWLEQDLAANPTACTVALLHEPRFSSGTIHGNNRGMEWLWQIMYDADVDVVLNGSEHIYERFAPQTPTGIADPQRGIRQITAGTGGYSHYGIGTVQPNSEVRNADTFGILKLTLNPGAYQWRFLPEAGKSFTDTGSTPCH